MGCTAFFDLYLSCLLVVIVMVMVVVMMMVSYCHHDLRLRRIRHCEAEYCDHSKQKPFHNLGWSTAELLSELL